MNPVRRCLMELDVPGIRAAWATLAPHLPQGASDAETLVAMHRARTGAESIPLNMRAYSHRWLLERGYPSGLPDRLRPRVDQTQPVIVDGVGVAVKAASALTVPIVGHVREAMSSAVEDCYANGDKAPALVRLRMHEARTKAVRQLLGVSVK
jgi:hypothetical protein